MSDRELRHDEAGVCPVCGGELEYGGSGLQDNGYFYDWKCKRCGTCGREWYNLVFSEHILKDATVGQLEKKYLHILEKYDWCICGYTGDGRVELEKYSPAGEDFIMCIETENFPEAIAEYAADFDPDEHIEMWIEAKQNGARGIPSTRELVKDAEAIDKMLQELAAALMEAAA